MAPFPSWRLAANGTISQIVHAGSTVYLGGSFTKIGRALTPFQARLDPATLALTPLNGCARRDGALVRGPFVDYPTGLSDGDGPFTVPATARFVRVGSDCRFDRRFRVELPAGVGVHDPEFVAQVSGRVYLSAFTNTGPPPGTDSTYVVEADAVTGALLRFWPVAGAVRIRGAVQGSRVLATSGNATGELVLGWFDPAQGQFVPVQVLQNEWGIVHVGDVVVTRRTNASIDVLTAWDGATLAPLAQWPRVQTAANLTPPIASSAGRVFLAGAGIMLDGVAAPRIVGFDAATGARLGEFTAPAWLDDAGGSFTMLHATGSRVLVFGEFAPGAPRDTAVALDATTGALDAWTWTYAATPQSVLGGQVYFPTIDAVDRVARAYLAAVDERSGTILPWTTSPAPPSGVTALAADAGAGHLYAAWRGAIRRFDLTSAIGDSAWRLDVRQQANVTFAEPSTLGLLQGVVYASGTFDEVRDAASGAFQPREGAAAITTVGTLTPWRPQVEGVCLLVPRPPLRGPCITDLDAVDGRLVLRGAVRRLQAPNEPTRTLLAVTAETGAVDGFLPPVTTPVSNVATDGTALFTVAQFAQPSLVRVDGANGARAIATLSRMSTLALRPLRVYADLERDADTGAPTGNPKSWLLPVAAGGGVLDGARAWSWHGDIAPVAPRPPEQVVATLDGARLTLRWAPGSGDLAADVAPPPPGGTAAMSHVVQASLTPGGPVVASFDTASADTTWSMDAPPGVFYLRVAARNQFGTSLPSTEVAVPVRPAAPGRPIATRAVVTGSTVHLEWSLSSSGWAATSFVLEAGTAPGLSNLGTLPLTGTSFEAAVPAGRYYVRIRAVNASGTSGPGDEVILDVP